MTELQAFYDSGLFTYLILPLLIFLARICDVTIGTMRIVMVAKGQKFWAPVMGFFEVLIWIITMSKVVQNLDNWLCYVGYAGGFATGNLVGLLLEEKLAMGIVKIQIITRKEASQLIEALREAGYGITHHPAKGGTENVSIIHSIVKRSEIAKVEEIIRNYNPKAFYSIEDVKFVSQGIFPIKDKSHRWRLGK
ncbi:MAG TPA: DUF2179 domain-containing protein [Prolixibacteraceae bacterium]|jgi:uncharacterized protein YebE (UPF0316 family)|nr:DUF2179 domain-containing protein [Bacteroidales bacterium]HPJ79351.1 DUF2179 domain-containing protein [Prolixibacteraceae bacterium]HRV88883.1 DUF2179 domain-containing protein [Prolixibacteraceae bacterium]